MEAESKAIIHDIPIEYAGGYVLFHGWNNNKIVAHGTDLSKMFQEAKRKGAINPIIMFVPDPNITYISMVA